MQIAGILKNSFVDFPGKIAAVVFAQGCNFDCYYCHNSTLIPFDAVVPAFPEDDFFELLEKRKNFIDGVVISGGEPTLQQNLLEFCLRVKEFGLLVKLDTNGTFPTVLEELIEQKAVDYIAMDIKAGPKKYNEICGKKVELKGIMRSIELLMNGKIDYEFRTTLTSRLDRADILEIVELIKGAKRYVLQQVEFSNIVPERRELFAEEKPHSEEYIKAVVKEIEAFFGECIVRGI